ncbi:diacetylchitobiose deacetylase [Clostridium zeae]|uniref:Diacetylchitobiose deacetylase n=1 Tax=Clostridium zeae TaxID=2759022 RepID=A0ABQ1E7X3_9CLOT|nr:PIG-L family deacetylase [Clostridium zeae]GFZ30880.1 diacetylchitobiose deacetylase [Clostridium zeae]
MIQILNKILSRTTKVIPIPKYCLPSISKALIVAPHMDDDIVGCGGTIHRIGQAGAEVSVLYLTNGCRGNSNMQYDEQLGNVRRLEAEKAFHYITGERFKNLFYMDICDECVSKHLEETDDLKKILMKDEYDAIFVPYVLDIHPDHRAANYLLTNVLEKIDKKITIYFYEVWVPLIPNLIVDITASFSEKCNAMKMHESQMATKNYIKMISCLNGYRANFADRDEMLYAEAFYKCSIDEYIQIISEVRQGLVY